MRIDLFIARRLRLSDNNGNHTKTSIKIATAGVVLSVIIMLITIAVTSGFKHEIINKLIGFNAPISISAEVLDASCSHPIVNDVEAVEKIVNGVLPNVLVEESVKLPAMLKTDESFAAVVFSGYSDNGHIDFIADNIIAGEIPDFKTNPNKIVISSTVAEMLNVKVGDKISTCFFVAEKMRLRNFEISGIYNSGFEEYDKIIAYSSISTLKKIAGIPDGSATSLEVSGVEFGDIVATYQMLQLALNSVYYDKELTQSLEVGSIINTGAMYLNWLSLLDTNVVVILVLMTAISSFTLIASLIILILERVNMIGTLKMLGATDSVIRRVFILLDLKVLVKGLVVGNIVALLLIILQQQFQLLPLDPESYYISFVPVKIELWQVAALNLGAIVIATAVMIFPSMIISRLKPAMILRYE